MSAPMSRMVGQIASRRLFSSTARVAKGGNAAAELRALFNKTAVNPQRADWGKMARVRAVTFGIYVTGLTSVLGWPWLAKWAWDGKLGNGLW